MNIEDEINYSTFVRIISDIPSCIFFKDTKLRYRFSTKCWEQLLSADIVGKSDLEIRRDRENAILATENDLNILRTGKGCKYVIKSEIENSIKYLEIIKAPVVEKGKTIGIVGLINDITEQTVLQNKINELLTTDSLTGIYNRKTGTDLINICLENETENKAFCLLDVDKFKNINDTYGHRIGDEVLKELGSIINESIYSEDIAFRLGGDEFIVFLNNITEIDQVESFINKLCEKIRQIKIGQVEENITVSVGVSMVDDNSTFDSLYTKADKNMYDAKNNGLKFIIN